jgi:hypothetical protein
MTTRCFAGLRLVKATSRHRVDGEMPIVMVSGAGFHWALLRSS